MSEGEETTMGINVLWIVGTALAASPDDPRVAAATDGQRIWLTVDAGEQWRRIADFGPGAGAGDDPGDDAGPIGEDDGAWEDDGGEDDGGGDDGGGDSRVGADALDALAAMNVPLAPGEETRVRALAIVEDTLFEATVDGVYAQRISGGRPVRVARDRLATLAAADGALWGTTENALLRSGDGGRRFRAVLRLPDGVRGLAVHGRRALLATDTDVHIADPATGKSRALEVGPAAVAASEDGSFWRAAPDGIFRSRDGGRSWTRHTAYGARALAVGAGDVWVATGGRVGRASQLRESSLAAAALPYRFYDDAARPDAAALAADLLDRQGDDTGAGDRRALWLPAVSARARVIDRAAAPGAAGVYGWETEQDEAVFEIVLQWRLERGDRP